MKLVAFLAGLLALNFGTIKAQIPINIEFVAIDKNDTTSLPPLFLAKDSSAATDYLSAQIQLWQQKGYILASIDSLNKTTSDSLKTWRANVFLGQKYRWGALNTNNIETDWLKEVGFRSQAWTNAEYAAKNIDKLSENLLIYCENNGYPFARLRFDSLILDSNALLSATLQLDKGPRIQMASLVLETIEAQVDGQKKDVTARISRNYLQYYLGIRAGTSYSEKNIQKMRSRLDALPFLQPTSLPYIVFSDEKATTHFFLRQRRASRFDFLVGLQPNDNPLLPQQRQISLTGNVLIDLQNPFGFGERLMLSWQRFQIQTSQLKTKATLPYLFGSPIGADLNFELYRRDSTYIDIIGEIGGQYLLQGGNYLKLYWRNATTNVTNIDTSRIRITRQLPSILDLTTNWVGLEYLFQQLDYRFNPRRGFSFKANISTGRKQIRPNIGVLNLTDPRFDFSTLYDSVGRPSFQIRWIGDFSFFLPLGRRATLLTRLQSGFLWSSSKLSQNELFRIGGNRIQRGFDEESIFASTYAAATVEGRYLLNQNSYFFAFADAAFVDTRARTIDSQTYPYSFGIGLALDTKIGLFGVSYALGTYFGSAIQVRNAKIHFGYINMF
jgi:outer membrane protein assembly factor BamA